MGSGTITGTLSAGVASLSETIINQTLGAQQPTLQANLGAVGTR